MRLSEIFAKDIQRPIEGVIKADDVTHLGTEVEEYVLTNEAAKGLEHLLEEYTSYTNANGVWISGFFGSGKSHLLKMLAHLLGDVEGQAYPRQRVAESFRSKSPDAFLPGLLDKVGRIPARSLLFNIDVKATLISKDQTDALLKVFVKVFDESRGYFGNHGHVARFERDLDDRGQYAAFQEAYERIAGIPWSRGRTQTMLEGPSIDQAFAEVNGGAATDIIKQYSTSYQVAIEDFADEVKSWLDKQDNPNFRLNFFVDEVGQFIGSDTKLMLNLQTIAESLNTKCGGRSWVFVTSQEDMDRVIGDRTRQQGNDFSKIQARFKTRVKLSSADVEEVIRKRLLEKNAGAAAELNTIYATQHASFKTLFNFVDGAKTYRNYIDETHFVGTYPFVSYQFPLFQSAIIGISEHNLFEGRNNSVGERSMLGVVQEVAQELGDLEVGHLATFDSMFEGIRASLKSAAQRAVDTAQRHVPNPLAIRLLKALFLVKYVNDFQATARNLTVLVYDQFDLDLPALTDQVKAALALLEAELYIQRKGNAYEYLTDEEKAIEEEIKNVDIDSSEVSAQLFKILSSEVVKTTKIRYGKNGQDFAFGFKLDDQTHGPQKELSIHFISPEYPYEPHEIRAHSMGKDELRVILAEDPRAFFDLRLLIKTRKYIQRKQGTSLSALQQQILQAKGALNTEREKDLGQRIREAVGKAALVINAADVDAKSADPVTRVTEGFQDLVGRTYTQLRLLGGRTYGEQQIASVANPPGGLFEADIVSQFSVPADEVLSLITRKIGVGEQVSVKTIADAFTSKPYGWDIASVEVVLGFLVGNSRITLTLDGNILRRSEVAAALRNTQRQPHTVVTLQKTFDEKKVTAFRKFCMDFFDDPNPPKDPVELARYGAGKLKAKRDELKGVTTGSRYLFTARLDMPIGLLDQVIGKPDDWYLTDFDLGDDLLDAREDLIDPIQVFLRGPQRAIFDSAEALLAANASNLTYLPAGSDDAVRHALGDPNAFRGNKMTQLKQASDQLQKQIDEVVAASRAKATAAIEARKAELLASSDYAKATTTAQESAAAQVDQVIARLKDDTQVAHLRELGSSFETAVFPRLLDSLTASQQPADDETPPPPVKQTVSVKKITVPGATGLMETEADIDRYLAALRTALVQALNDGKRISL